ncbi:hypothetical protein B5M09_013674, partial [Aphanomyces astaci]
MSAKMAEITQNSIRKVKETVREYTWRINDAAQDLELRHSQAAQIFIDGCKDPGLASCIRGSETRPGTIQECLDYLRFRDMDLDMRLNDANGHDVPRSTHEVDTENDVAGSPIEEGYPHDGSMRTLGRVGYALEVEVGFPTELYGVSRRLNRLRWKVTGPEKLTLPSVNDPSVRWVFTPHQIEAIVWCDFPGIVEGLHSDMEDRMLPLTKADVADQVRKIRGRRKSPTHRDIAEVIMQAIQRRLADEDMRLLETPADMDDPARWLRWFASALETCEEARRVDRNFNDNRSALVATTRLARFYRKFVCSTEIHSVGPVAESESGRLHLATLEMFEKSVVAAVGCDVRPRKRVNFYGRAEYRFDLLGFTASIPLVDLESTRRPDEVWRLNCHCFAPRRPLQELAAGHIVHHAEVTPLRPRELARTPRLPVGSVAADSGQLIGEAEVIHSNPFYDTEP